MRHSRHNFQNENPNINSLQTVNKNDTFSNFPSIKDTHPSPLLPSPARGDEQSTGNVIVPTGDNDDLKAELLLLAAPAASSNTTWFAAPSQDQQFQSQQKADNFILSKNAAKTKYQKYSDFKRKGNKNKRTLMSDLVKYEVMINQ